MRALKKTLAALTLGALALPLLVAPVALSSHMTPVAPVAHAQEVNVNNPILAQDTNIADTVRVILNWVLGIVGIFSVLFLVIGGFRYVVSAGNEDQIEAAKGTIKAALIGLIIVIISLVLVNTLIGFLAG